MLLMMPVSTLPGLRSHSGGASVWRHRATIPIWRTSSFFIIPLWPTGPRQYPQAVYCTRARSAFVEAFPVHRCAHCAKRMATIKRDGEPEVRKGKEMYKQRERTRDKASDQEIAKAAAARDVLSPGPVRHRLGSEGCETWVGRAKSRGLLEYVWGRRKCCVEEITACERVWGGRRRGVVGRESNSVLSPALLSSIHCPHPVCVLLPNGF